MLTNIMEIGNNTRKAFNLYSTMNTWTDLIIMVHPDDYSKAMYESQQYIFDWHDEDTCEPIGNYIKRRLSDIGIEADVYGIIEEDEYDSE